MAAHRKDPKVLKYGVSACVTADTKMKLQREAKKLDTSIGAMIGAMLDDWGKEQVSLKKDERKLFLFKGMVPVDRKMEDGK